MNVIIREVRFRALAAKGDIDKGLKLFRVCSLSQHAADFPNTM